ncbi:MAG: hypothetical protein ACTHKQ_05240 [Mesorhizobium sp.]
MQLLFLDDSFQRRPSRQRVGPLVAVGGVSIPAKAARELERMLNILCAETGFPPGEPFKWSPAKDHWMRDNLVAEQRTEFLGTVLATAAAYGAVGQVAISDKTRNPATRGAKSHEMDVLVMALERFNYSIDDDLGMVIVARPSGGRTDEDNFLAECVEVVMKGTDYSEFEKFATNILTMPFPNSRILQVADLVVSITTAMVAGHTEFAAPVFHRVKALLRTGAFGRIGGVGVKIHPDFCYANLYHWILGDDTFARGSSGWSLPMANFPFSNNADEY